MERLLLVFLEFSYHSGNYNDNKNNNIYKAHFSEGYNALKKATVESKPGAKIKLVGADDPNLEWKQMRFKLTFGLL